MLSYLEELDVGVGVANIDIFQQGQPSFEGAAW